MDCCWIFGYFILGYYPKRDHNSSDKPFPNFYFGYLFRIVAERRERYYDTPIQVDTSYQFDIFSFWDASCTKSWTFVFVENIDILTPFIFIAPGLCLGLTYLFENLESKCWCRGGHLSILVKEVWNYIWFTLPLVVTLLGR